MYQSFDQLLHLDIDCHVASAGDGALLILGDQAGALAAQLQVSGKADVKRLTPRVLFGLPLLTAPYPLFAGSLMTERNTLFDQLSLYGWIEDHLIDQPRAEVFGLTPFAEQPVLFLRDLDPARPVEAWFRLAQPSRWLQVAGVAIATTQHSSAPQGLKGDEAALAALPQVLPADALPFHQAIQAGVQTGQSLKSVLRQQRKTTEPALMQVFDGWRVLAQAARFFIVNPAGDATITDVLKLSQTKRW